MSEGLESDGLKSDKEALVPVQDHVLPFADAPSIGKWTSPALQLLSTLVLILPSACTSKGFVF